jgi:MFS family permease
MLGLVAGIALGAFTGSLSPFATLPVAAATLVAVAVATVPLARIVPSVHDADPPVSTAPVAEGRRERIIASLMLASDRGLAAALAVIVPLAFGGDDGLPKATVGVLLGLPMLGMALGAVPGGSLADRFGALRVRVVGAVLFGLGTIGLVEAERLGTGAMFAAAALAGLGAAPLFPSALAIGTRDRGATGVYGAIQAAGQGGYALGNLSLAIAAGLAALAGVEGVPPSRTLLVAAIVYLVVNLVVAIAAPARDWAGRAAR